MPDPFKIYIAGPYSGDTEEQIQETVNSVIDAAFIIFSKGHFPYVPHLTHFIDLRAKEKDVKLRWEDYIKWDMVWLELCNAFLYLHSSTGANLELQAAKKWGKKVFYSLNEIPHVNGTTK